jgi:hypothetical protein
LRLVLPLLCPCHIHVLCFCVSHSGNKAQQENANPSSNPAAQHTPQLPKANKLTAQLNQPQQTSAAAPPAETCQQPATQTSIVLAALLDQARQHIKSESVREFEIKVKGLPPTFSSPKSAGELVVVSWGQRQPAGQCTEERPAHASTPWRCPGSTGLC